MKKTAWRAAVGAVSFMLSLWPTASWSEFKITPSVSVREEFNDNINLTRSNREDDFITTINPALSVRYSSRIVEDLSLDYGLNFRFYADHSERNETSLSEAQRAKLGTTISPIKDILFIKISEEYARVPIDQRRQVALDNISVNMTDSNRFSVNPYIAYPLAKTLKLNAGYRYDNLWYKSKEGDDADNHTFNVGLVKELTPNLSSFVSYDYQIHNTEITEDYNRQSVSVGANYRLGKFALSGSLGRARFDYDTRKDESFNTSSIQVTGAYQLTNLISLSGGYSKGFSDSVNQGTYQNETTSGTISYSGKIPLSLTVYETTSKYLTTNRKDESKGITLGSSIPIYLTPKLTGNLSFNYSTLEVDTPDQSANKEEIDRYTAGLSLSYEMKITTLSIGYTWNWNDSNINTSDYKNNIVWVQARFAF